MSQQQSPRTCGGCTACCTTHGVHELLKGNGQTCSHSIRGIGCRIHEHPSFPLSCAEYHCFWRNGKGDARDRPDILKIVMDGEEFTVGKRKTGIWNMWEVERGARHQLRVIELTNAITEHGVVVRHYEFLAVNNLRQHFFRPRDMSDAFFRRFLRELATRDRAHERFITLPGST